MSSEYVSIEDTKRTHAYLPIQKEKKMNTVFPKLYDYRTVLFSSAH